MVECKIILYECEEGWNPICIRMRGCNAVLALDRFDSSKHSGIISEFRRRYLKDHILPVEISKIIDSAFEIRQDSDYDDGYEADIEETSEQIRNASTPFRKFECVDCADICVR